ncbi:MAG: M28 family peptidase [Eubacteriales bacterium]|nr:M28 family peptidase [Eubacteriales bacterium]
MKKKIFITGYMFAFLFCCSRVYAETGTDAEEYMKSAIEKMTENPRMIGTPEIDDAKEYLVSELKNWGYDVQEQDFFYDDRLNEKAIQSRSNKEEYLRGAFTGSEGDKRGTNIIAEKAGSSSDRTLIISAHYDTCENSPGANDNASGVAVLLNAARMYSQKDYPFNIRFICFSGEEAWFAGSRYYVSSLEDSGYDNIMGVINIDSVAEKSNLDYWVMVSEGKEVVDESGTVDFEPIANEISELITKKTEYQLVCQMNSDHYPFSLLGIPAVTITQDLSEELHINSSEDTMSYIDSNRLVEVFSTVDDIIQKETALASLAGATAAN